MLQLPVSAEIAEYRRTSSQYEKHFVSGDFAPGEWPAQHVYDFWMGNEDLGVNLVLEGCVGWPTETDETQLELSAAEGEALFTAHIAREPLTLAEPLTVSVGLQATPVRPLPEKWRAQWRLSPRVGYVPDVDVAQEYGANYAVIWWSARPDSPRWFAFPEPTDPEAFRAMVDAFHERGIKVLIYQNLTTVSPNVPEAIEYSGEWFETPKPVALPDPDDAAPPARWHRVDQKHPDWIDFIVGWEAKIIDEYGVDGWYFDCAIPYGMRETHPIFEYREACKRAYVALHSRRADGGIITHMSGHYTAAVMAFTDAMLQGEQYRWPLPHWQVQSDYAKVLRLDYARAELTGLNLGVVPVFLPEFPGGDLGPRNRRNSEHMLAVTRLHDMVVWPIWCDPKPVRELWQAQDRFGIGEPDVQFLPYWGPSPAQVDANHIMVSAYRRPGKAILVVSNFLGDEDERVTVKPDLELLGLAGGYVAEDLLTGGEIPVAEGAMTLDLPEGRARYILLGRR